MKQRDPFNWFPERKADNGVVQPWVAPCASARVVLFCTLLLLSVAVHSSFAQTNPPSISGIGQSWAITDKQVRDPFPNASISHPDGGNVTVDIVISPAGFGGFQSVSGMTTSGTTNTITLRSTSSAQGILRGLTFAPLENQIDIGSTRIITFTVSGTGTNGVASTNNSATTVTITPVNDDPTLTGVASTSITDKSTANPFAGVTIADVDNRGTQTVTVTITQDDAAKGIIQVGSSGFTSGGGAVYSFTGTPAAATAAIHQLVFDPTENRRAPGFTETTSFTLIVTDAIGASVSSSAASVVTTSINDAPVLSGTSPEASLETGRALNPFPNILITDPDPVDNSGDTNVIGSQRVSIVVRLTGTNVTGSLEAPGFSGPVFAISGITPQEATAQLRELVYRAQNTPLSTTNLIGFSITTTDTLNAFSVNTNTVVKVSTPFTAPGLSGTRTEQRVNDNNTLMLFSTVSIQSFNAGSFRVIVRMDDDAKGDLINLGGFSKSTATSPASYVFDGTSEAATVAIRQILFRPVLNRVNGSSNELVRFSIVLVDGGTTNSADTSTSVVVTPVPDTPQIQGTSPLVTIGDNATHLPFPTVLITDVDESGQQIIQVTVRLDDNAKGGFSTNSLAASGFAFGGGAYTNSGTPAAMTTAIRKLVFVPVSNRVPVGLTETTVLSIHVNDGHAGVVENSSTLIRVAALESGPVVTVPNPQPLSLPFASPLRPLGAVTISAQQDVAVTLNVNPGFGTFTEASLLNNGFTNEGSGIFVFGGTPANATTGIADLEFVPDANLAVGAVITFSITAVDQTGNSTTKNLAVMLRQNQRSLIVTRTSDYGPTAPDSEKYGTLRKAVEDAGSNDHITFDLRSMVPGLPDYPATIRLQRALVLNKNVTVDGPGAERLTISGDTDGDGNGDVQLFQVGARVTLNRLTLTKGVHSFAGGAIGVVAGGELTLNYSAVTDSQAGVWGGGIDVDGGSLLLDHCLIRGNQTSAEAGQGGGGVSIYTTEECRIIHTTFAGNSQLSPAGLGGGALYVEALDPGAPMNVFVLSSTFHDNLDEADLGSSIRPNQNSARIHLQNSIVADGQGRNLEMDHTGVILSLGGNISDDATTTTFSTGGAPTNTIIFRPPLDWTNTAPTLLALANNGGPTLTYGLAPSSVAIAGAISNRPAAPFYGTLGTDQRGYWRDLQPDVGAFEANAAQRISIEQIHFSPPAPNTNDEFIEFYVPRDSTSLNVAGLKLFVNGSLKHTFSSQALVPGEALVLFSQGAVNTGVPTGVYRQIASSNLHLDDSAGIITLLNSSNQVLLVENYVGSYVSSDPSDPGYLSNPNQAILRSPQYSGVFLPYQRVVAKEGDRVPGANEVAGAGRDAAGVPLAAGNAPPRAYDDVAATDAKTELPVITVLANDVDPDAADEIRVTGVITNGVPAAAILSTHGALVSVNDSPDTGASVLYDPRDSSFLRSLPLGSNVVDTFQYVIIDSSNGVDHVRGTTAGEINNNIALATATVTVAITGVNWAPTPLADSAATDSRLATTEKTVLDFTTWDALLANDTDPNTDDNGSTLTIISVQPTAAYENTLQTMSALGAFVSLDIRFNRNETHIFYDPRSSEILRSLAQGQTAADTFYYSVMDRHGAIGSAEVQITVTGVNDSPTAIPDFVSTDEDTPLSIPVDRLLANDLDPDTGITPQIPPVLIVSLPTASTFLGAGVQVVGTNVVYDPTISSNLNALARKEMVIDTFDYTTTDAFGAAQTTTVSVSVTGVNDHPVAAPDAYATGEKSVLTVAVPGALSNDRDPDVNGVPSDDTLMTLPFADALTPGGANVTMGADGSFGYDPRGHFAWLRQGQVTNDWFAYTVIDHSLTIATDDSFNVRGGSTSNLLPVLANDVILSQAGGALRIIATTAPNRGGLITVTELQDAIVYAPVTFSGTETFTYTISDGQGGFDVATVTIQLTPNTLRVNGDTFTVAKGTTVNLDVLANDRVLPSSSVPLSILGVSQPDQGGSATRTGVGPNNQIIYTPGSSPAYPFTESFAYTFSAGGSQIATGLVVATVIDRTLTLSTNDDSFTVIAGSGNNTLDVLANDPVLPGPNTNLTITSIQTNSVSGTVTINPAGNRLIYRPAAGVNNHQEPLIYYTISDGAGGTATASVSLRVVERGFIANDDVVTVYKNSRSNIVFALVNDVVLPNVGQNLTITGIGLGANAPQRGGSATVSSLAKTIVYTPASGYVGEESFTYEISDGSVARAEGRIRVRVLDSFPLNVNADAFAVARNSVDNSLPVLKNDYVLPRSIGSLTITSLKTNATVGSVSLNGTAANNSIFYTPQPGYIGRDTFGYVVSDGYGNVGETVVTITVGGLIVERDQFTVLSDSSNNALEILANDLQWPDTAAIRPVVAVNSVDQGGSVAIESTGARVLYAPAPGFVGVEHFTYEVQDDAGFVVRSEVAVSVVPSGSDRDSSTVTVTVIGTNDPPTIVGAESNLQITDKQTVRPFPNMVIADVDAYGADPLLVRVTLDDPAKGSLINLGGFIATTPGVYAMFGLVSNITSALQQLVFVPVENRIMVPASEAAQFTVFADDGYSGVTNAATVVIVTAANDAPTITGTRGGQRVYDRSSLRPFDGVTISDVDDLGLQPLSLTVTLDVPSHGYLTSLGGFTSVGGGVYQISGVTAAQANSALRGLLFIPTPGTRIPEGGSETTRLTLAVNDGFSPPVVDITTTIISLDGYIAKLLASDGSKNDEFGFAVAASRDLVVAGAPFDDSSGNKSGSVYLFSRNFASDGAWTQVKKLLGTDSKKYDQFGYSVGIDADTIIVGARKNNNGQGESGAAYIFQRNQNGVEQWGQVKKLLAPDGVKDEEFGVSVAISGDTAAVGAHRHKPNSSRTGAVYIFGRNQGGANQWGFVKKVLPGNGVNDESFGFSVALENATLVVGGLNNSQIDDKAGAAYVFERNQSGLNQWGQTRKLTAADGAKYDNFGQAVAINNNTIVVGAHRNTDGGKRSGSAYVFARAEGGPNAWGQVRKLVPFDGSDNDEFGFSVTIHDGIMAVGSHRDDDNGYQSGSTYLYAVNLPGIEPWSLLEKVKPSDTGKDDEFGYAVSLHQNTLIVGARRDEIDGRRFGSSHIYRLKFNNAPYLAAPIPDQVAVLGSPFNYVLKDGTFGDNDSSDTLTLSMSAFPAPPAWLSFNPVSKTFSGVPDAAGTAAIVLRATDSDGISTTVSFNIVVLATGIPRDATRHWRGENFSADALGNASMESTVWGDAADPDGDRVSNLQEYIFCTDPLSGSPADATTLTIQPTGKREIRSVSYLRRAQDWRLVYLLETSLAGQGWQVVDEAMIASESIVRLSGDVEWVKQMIRVGDTDGHARLFRLKVVILTEELLSQRLE